MFIEDSSCQMALYNLRWMSSYSAVSGEKVAGSCHARLKGYLPGTL
jgi:hypothetical protein